MRSPRLSPRQIRKMWRSLIEEERAAAAERMRQGRTLRKFPGGPRTEAGTVRDQIGALAGVCGRSVDKVNAIYDAYEADPVLFGRAVAYLESTENIHQAHKMMRRLRDEARVLGLTPIDGTFATLILDPPWRDDSVSETQRPPYATMSLEEIAALPVAAWARAEAHLYVWVPNNLLLEAGGMLAAWGFAYKTVLTWTKPKWGTGRYFRNQTEQVLFATRGGLMTRTDSLGSSFPGPVGEHSAKPDSFYDLVRAASYPPYGEAFQREARPGFTNLYAPTVLEAAA